MRYVPQASRAGWKSRHLLYLRGITLFAGIRRWDLITMFVILGVITTFELIGVFSPKMVTITQIIKATVPIPIRIMLCSWLTWHFVVSDIVKQITPVAK
jgi:hypothetical protein